MKNKIVFAGAMAAILGAVNASAADVKIASQNYVTNQVKTVSDKVGDVADLAEGVYVNEDASAIAAILSLDTQLGVTAGKVTTVEGRVDTVEGNVTNLTTNVTNLTTNITELQQTVNGEGGTGGVADRLEELEETINGQGGTGGVADRLGTVEGTLSTVQGELADKADASAVVSKTGNTVSSVVTTDASGNIAYVNAIAEGQVSGLTTKLNAINALIGDGDLDTDATDLTAAINELVADIDALSGDGSGSLGELKTQLQTLAGKVGNGELTAGADLIAAVNALYTTVNNMTGDSGFVTDGGDVDGSKVDMGTLAANHIVTTDATGKLTTTDKISSAKVTGLGNIATFTDYQCSGTGMCVLSLQGSNLVWTDVAE